MNFGHAKIWAEKSEWKKRLSTRPCRPNSVMDTIVLMTPKYRDLTLEDLGDRELWWDFPTPRHATRASWGLPKTPTDPDRSRMIIGTMGFTPLPENSRKLTWNDVHGFEKLASWENGPGQHRSPHSKAKFRSERTNNHLDCLCPCRMCPMRPNRLRDNVDSLMTISWWKFNCCEEKNCQWRLKTNRQDCRIPLTKTYALPRGYLTLHLRRENDLAMVRIIEFIAIFKTLMPL